MRVNVSLPSGEVVTLDGIVPQLESLKERIEAATTIPAVCQELSVAGSPLEVLPELEELDVDLLVRVGRRYAIASASLPPVSGSETFRPARSIELARDLERFRHLSRQCRFSDNRPMRNTADISQAEGRAAARLEPYRNRAGVRRARLKDVCASLRQGPLLAMTFNSPYAPLFENWHRSCRHHGIDVRPRTVVFPMDPQADSVARRLGYATFFDPESYGDFQQRSEVKFGDGQWVDCLFMKSAVLDDMLAMGVDVLFQDADVIWRRNPIPYLQAKANLECWDFMFQKGGINAIFQPLYYNSGFVYARSNEFSRLTWERVLDNQCYCYVYRSQQVPVNIVMNAFRERGLRTCALEESLFVNGHLVPVEPKPDAGELHPQAFVIHFNWNDGLATKLDRLSDNGVWYPDAATEPAEKKPQALRRAPSRHEAHAQCLVSHRLRCVYMAIAKNASSTIRAELRRLDADVREGRCTLPPATAWRGYTTFAFLRDPVTRVLSAYQEISMRLDGKTVDELPFTKLAPGPGRFEAFLDAVEERPWDEHVRCQVDLIGDHRIDFWGRVETFQGDFARLLARLGIDSSPRFPQRRSRIGRARDYGYSEHLLWEKDLGAGTLERIRRIYADDIELLARIWPDARLPERPASDAWTAPVVRRRSG